MDEKQQDITPIEEVAKDLPLPPDLAADIKAGVHTPAQRTIREGGGGTAPIPDVTRQPTKQPPGSGHS